MKSYRAYTLVNGELSEIHSNGASAYEVALANGFKGSQEEWLKSLNGEKGDKGDKGDTGITVLNKEFLDDISDLPDNPEDNTLYFVESEDNFVTEINDDNVSKGTTYSSNKIEELVGSIDTTGIDDEVSSTETTYSSNKIEQLINSKVGSLAIVDGKICMTYDKEE